MKRGMVKMVDEARKDAPFETGGIPQDNSDATNEK